MARDGIVSVLVAMPPSAEPVIRCAWLMRPNILAARALPALAAAVTKLACFNVILSQDAIWCGGSQHLHTSDSAMLTCIACNACTHFLGERDGVVWVLIERSAGEQAHTNNWRPVPCIVCVACVCTPSRLSLACRLFTFADSVHERSAAAVEALQTGAWRGSASPQDALRIIMLTGKRQPLPCHARL